ncbi:cellulose binding domain-containing protein [Solwaraspora sp. WMMA2056]|uniref:Ig-like domain-containing protein n=1 Tax=Solwaraspora sp. WMMA2056 TaxID=3015161 RepID=UPI00259B38ED|nr:Ig-like domain-containing protein [Solwaraspora sp. WMMA2056]WJK39730.1 cellulose binding domain-containing protein [Solwaraspora sp. WMMA2056]
MIAAVLAATGMVFGFALRPAYAAPACTVDYQVTREWSTGFIARMTLTNLGPPVSTWRLTFTPGARQTINSAYRQVPPGLVLSALAWPYELRSDAGAYHLDTGESVRVQFSGSYSVANPPPTSYHFNGQACNMDPDLPPSPSIPPSPSVPPTESFPPVVALRSPQMNQIFATTAPIPVAADATAAAGRRITRVEFRSAGTLLHTDTTAPYAFTWHGAQPTNGTRITATAYDDAGTHATAEVRGVRVVSPAPPGHAPALTMAGNQLVTVDQPPRPYQLRGVVRAGAETLCRDGSGIFHGPVDDDSVQAMRRWRINAVRVLVDPECWLSRDTVPPAFRGAAYRDAISGYAQRLVRHGITPVLAWHGPATSLQRTFWVDVAAHFDDDNSILFDLYGDAYPAVGELPPDAAWQAWRDGRPSAGLPSDWPEFGADTLIYNIRHFAGSHNTLLIGGLDGGNDLSGWLAYRPDDPAGRNLAAAWRVDDDAACATVTCWQQQVAPVAAEVPLVAVEVSEDTGGHRFVGTAIDWLDTRRIGFLGSVWHTDGYPGVPPLIRDYDGRPTPYGAGVKHHLRR